MSPESKKLSKKLPKELEEFRVRIDALDQRLLRLLNERAALVSEIFQWKKRAGLPLEDKAREAELFQRLREHNPGPLSPDSVERLFREILDQSKEAFHRT